MAFVFMINFIDKDEPDLVEEILKRSDVLLNKFPSADVVVQTYIMGTHAINKDFYNIKVKRTDVEKALLMFKDFRI